MHHTYTGFLIPKFYSIPSFCPIFTLLFCLLKLHNFTLIKLAKKALFHAIVVTRERERLKERE